MFMLMKVTENTNRAAFLLSEMTTMVEARSPFFPSSSLPTLPTWLPELMPAISPREMALPENCLNHTFRPTCTAHGAI